MGSVNVAIWPTAKHNMARPTDRASCTNPMNVRGLISLSCHATTGSRTVNVVSVLVAMYVVCVMHEPLENMVTAIVSANFLAVVCNFMLSWMECGQFSSSCCWVSPSPSPLKSCHISLVTGNVCTSTSPGCLQPNSSCMPLLAV